MCMYTMVVSGMTAQSYGVFSVSKFERSYTISDEVGQKLYEVGQLVYEVGQLLDEVVPLLYEVGQLLDEVSPLTYELGYGRLAHIYEKKLEKSLGTKL